MDRDAFLSELADILEARPVEVDEGFALPVGDWDSMAVLEVIALVDEQFGVAVPSEKLTACATVGELLDLAHCAASGSDATDG